MNERTEPTQEPRTLEQALLDAGFPQRAAATREPDYHERRAEALADPEMNASMRNLLEIEAKNEVELARLNELGASPEKLREAFDWAKQETAQGKGNQETSFTQRV